jgi:hypothetical protein
LTLVCITSWAITWLSSQCIGFPIRLAWPICNLEVVIG